METIRCAFIETSAEQDMEAGDGCAWIQWNHMSCRSHMFDDSLLENFSAGTLRFLGMAIMLCACWRQRSPVGSPSTERSGRQVLEVWAAGPEGSSLGSALSVAGDLDGDGQPDLLVGARDAG